MNNATSTGCSILALVLFGIPFAILMVALFIAYPVFAIFAFAMIVLMVVASRNPS